MADVSGTVEFERALDPMKPEDLEKIMERYNNRSMSVERWKGLKTKPFEGLGQTSYTQRILIPDDANNRILIGKF